MFTDAVLVLVGHGTTLNENSAVPVYQHAGELRARGVFGEVCEAFWKQEPGVTGVVSSRIAQRVFIVPLFISEGYFSEEVIPRELGFRGSGREWSRILRRDKQTFYYCKPIGTHERMTAVVLERARAVVEQTGSPPAAETTLILAGHGTERNANSRRSIERQVELLRARNIYADVHAVFLDEEPPIPSCYELARTNSLIVVPFFMSDGLHTQEDIPVLLGKPKADVKQRVQTGQSVWKNPTALCGKLVWYSASVGSAPEIAEVILERVREAARG